MVEHTTDNRIMQVQFSQFLPNTLIVQWRVHEPSKFVIQVRFLVRVPKCPSDEIGKRAALKMLCPLDLPVRIWPRAPCGLIRELVYLSDLESEMCGFESHSGHQIRGISVTASISVFQTDSTGSSPASHTKNIGVVQRQDYGLQNRLSLFESGHRCQWYHTQVA